MSKSVCLSAGIVLLALFAIGCHTPLAMKQVQAKNPLAKNAAKTPTKLVDVWNSYAQTTPEGKVMRGMAGRIHFYDNKRDSKAIKVDGDLTVYLFDGNETDPAYAKPIKIYQFKADTLDEHYAYKKPLGHGYDFFLPIDEIGGDEKPLSIMVRFDDKLNNSYFVKDTPVNVFLAGRRPAPPEEPTIREFLESRSILAEKKKTVNAEYDSSVIQQVSYTSDNKKEGESERSRVSTISLGSDMTRRLIEAKDTIQMSQRPEDLAGMSPLDASF